MAERRTYRHKTTGLVSELDPIVARGMGNLIEEVKPGTKPSITINKLVADKATERKPAKEQKDG